MDKLNSKNPNITIETIQDSKNPDYVTMRLRWKVQESNGGNFLGMFLGNLESKGRVAFQKIKKSILEELELKEGDNLNEKLPVPARITVTELVESDHLSLEELDQLGFSPKLNPSTMEYLVSEDGEYIYRSSKLTAVDEVDLFVKHVGTVKDAPAKVEAKVTEADIPA